MTNPTLTANNVADLQDFQALLPDVRQYIRRQMPSDWADLASILRVIVDEPLDPLPILPLASCAAVGGNPREAIPVAAAWEVLSLAMRILDDLQDQDRPHALWSTIGLPRAFNFTMTLYALGNKLLVQAPWSTERYRIINRDFIDVALRL
ncbi:MAG: hypothetical protein HYR94_11775 [Chloroflexi bacterium]|nr:hypothetical protein [Chloroflexota bacterium]